MRSAGREIVSLRLANTVGHELIAGRGLAGRRRRRSNRRRRRGARAAIRTGPAVLAWPASRPASSVPPPTSGDRSPRRWPHGTARAPDRERRRRRHFAPPPRRSGRFRAVPPAGRSPVVPAGAPAKACLRFPAASTACHRRARMSDASTAARMPPASLSTSALNDSASTPRSPQYRITMAAAAPPHSSSDCAMNGTSRMVSGCPMTAAGAPANASASRKARGPRITITSRRQSGSRAAGR